jgi:hypothetical protein
MENACWLHRLVAAPWCQTSRSKRWRAGGQLGEVVPWISVNNENGHYLRKLLDRVSPTEPVMVHMVVEVKNHPTAELQTGNVYGIFLGKSGKYIILLDLFKQAASDYGVSMADNCSTDFPTEGIAFYPTFNDFGSPVSAGLLLKGTYYHTTADVDMNSISYTEIDKAPRRMAFIFDELVNHTIDDLREGESSIPEDSVYSSLLFKLFFGNN